MRVVKVTNKNMKTNVGGYPAMKWRVNVRNYAKEKMKPAELCSDTVLHCTFSITQAIINDHCNYLGRGGRMWWAECTPIVVSCDKAGARSMKIIKEIKCNGRFSEDEEHRLFAARMLGVAPFGKNTPHTTKLERTLLRKVLNRTLCLLDSKILMDLFIATYVDGYEGSGIFHLNKSTEWHKEKAKQLSKQWLALDKLILD